MHSIRSFLLSETGFSRPRVAFPFAWIAGILVGAAVLFGGPTQAYAAYCSITCPDGTNDDCSGTAYAFCYCKNEGFGPAKADCFDKPGS